MDELEFQNAQVNAMQAVANMLQKQENRFQKEDDEKEERDADEAEDLAKATFIKSVSGDIITAVQKGLARGEGDPGMDVDQTSPKQVSGTNWPMSRYAGQGDEEVPAHPDEDLDEQQQPIVAEDLTPSNTATDGNDPGEVPLADRAGGFTTKMPPEEEPGSDEYPMEEDSPDEYGSEMEAMKADLSELKTLLLATLTKGSGTNLSTEVADLGRKIGIRESGEGRMTMAKVRIIPDDEDPLALRKALGDNASTSQKAQALINRSYSELVEMQFASDPNVQRQPGLEELIENMS